ncbi:MAG: cryptochrome/photolyase family protein [Wenzhouxiangella sp.]|nr:MAG: cryptochrome/photolyase family protein [Wenzhouxiangella sp.]
MARLGLIFGDQLNQDHALLDCLDPASDRLLMGELVGEATHVWHHAKKIALVFAAMRHRADALREAAWTLDYHRYDPDSACQSFTDLVAEALRDREFEEIVVSWPGEWRVLDEVRGWEKTFGIPVTVLPDSRFLCPLEDFESWADGRKQLRMEYFYRQMRRRTGLLMDGDQPRGGAWNFDRDNRKPWRGDPPPARPMRFKPDETTAEVLELVADKMDAFGSLDDFDLPVTPTQARQALAHFIRSGLPHFGDFQDAMADDEDWLFHSRLSFSMNLGLLDPIEVCEAAERALDEGQAPINAVEGFIRQVIGWREYVRGIYWMKMPAYADMNELDSNEPLPAWYWTGETGMRCLAQTIDATRRNAYAHHIQRLMVTGNFALIFGVLPREICEWYLAVYADAYDWVELPNTLGMVMHADGGLLGSKPYAASGKYIQRMSNYCKQCRYQVADTVGEKACPFNALYWDFLDRNRERLESNQRMRMMYRNLDRMDSDKLTAIRERAAWLRENADSL